jgi:hypothetical protein
MMGRKIKLNLRTETVSKMDVIIAALNRIDDRNPPHAERWKNATRKAGHIFTSNDVFLMSAMHDRMAQYQTTEHSCECEAFQVGMPCYHRAYLMLSLRYAQANMPDNGGEI